MKVIGRGAIVLAIALLMAAMVSTAAVSAAPAQADSAVAGPAKATAAAHRCGHQLRWDPPSGPDEPILWHVTYRHCTSGSDSIRVRAIIRFHVDGACTTVGPRQTREIDTYWFPSGVFDRIARC